MVMYNFYSCSMKGNFYRKTMSQSRQRLAVDWVMRVGRGSDAVAEQRGDEPCLVQPRHHVVTRTPTACLAGCTFESDYGMPLKCVCLPKRSGTPACNCVESREAEREISSTPYRAYIGVAWYADAQWTAMRNCGDGFTALASKYLLSVSLAEYKRTAYVVSGTS